jgi:hypothetical protein
MVAALGFDARTSAAWWARSGRQGQAVLAYLVEHPRDLGQGQADALRVKQQGGLVWMAMAMLGRTRLWLGGEVREQRDLPLSRRWRERGRRCAAHRPLWVCPAGVGSYIRAMRATLRDPVPTGQGGRPRWRPWRNVLSAQGGKRDARRHGVAPARRLGDGTPARVETLRQCAQGAGGLKTAASERLNATCRERLALLARRCRALARQPLPLREGLCVVGIVSNGCTPHESLHTGQKTTPAMAAGSTDHGWTRQELLSVPVPLPRWAPPKQHGRPSHAFQRLMARWCS